ncbi:unnamed protein product, partial [marine sediment metagenome]
MESYILTDINNDNGNNYLNVFEEENEAKLATFILTDINTSNNTNFLNVSVHNNIAGNAPEAKLASHLPDKQGSNRHSGSIPGWGALPAFDSSSINISGLSVDEINNAPGLRITKKQIKDVKAGEYVLSLDEETGEIVSNRVNALLDMGEKPVFELITESGRSVNTTGKHPYFVKDKEFQSEDVSNL